MIFITLLLTLPYIICSTEPPAESKGLSGLSKNARFLLLQEIEEAHKEAESANKQMITDMQSLARKLPGLFNFRQARLSHAPDEDTRRQLDESVGGNPYNSKPHLKGEMQRHLQENLAAGGSAPSRLNFLSVPDAQDMTEGQIFILEDELKAQNVAHLFPGTIHIAIDGHGSFRLWGSDLEGKAVKQSGQVFSPFGQLQP